MTRDAVEEAGLESFPASDAPAWGRAAEPTEPAEHAADPSPARKGAPGGAPAATPPGDRVLPPVAADVQDSH